MINIQTIDELAHTVYVGNLPEDITEEGLKNVFITFGDIKAVDIPREPIS